MEGELTRPLGLAGRGKQWLMPNRPSASSPRPKGIRPRTLCKRRLRLYEMRIALYS